MIEPNRLVSVLVCVYNCEKYISECIESVLNQSFIDYEFIIIDDGSTDKTAEIIEKYAKLDNRIKFFKKKNTGLTNSLNYGIGLANSNYILRLDADDLMLANRIEIVYELILHTEADIVVNRSLLINSYGIKIKHSKKLNYDSFKKYLLLGFSPFAHSSVIFKKDKVIELGLYSSFYEKSQDYDLWLRMLEAGTKFYFCNQILTALRIHNESITSSEIDYYSIIALMNHRLESEFNKKLSNDELFINKTSIIKWLNENKTFKIYQRILKIPILNKVTRTYPNYIYYLIYKNFKKYAKRINPIKFI